MKKPIEIACRTCASQPGDRCRTPRLDIIEFQDQFHEERVIDAVSFGEASLSLNQRRLEIAALDKAAEKMV